MSLEEVLRLRRSSGGKLLVPYITAGASDRWLEVIDAYSDAGADAIEVGLPFSDPMMDGPTIEEASRRALAGGATPSRILDDLAGHHSGVPLIVMTYYNLIAHVGHPAMARRLAAAGVSGAIVPDLSVDEAGGWSEIAAGAGIDNILMAAPTSSDSRLERICAASRGFVYSVGILGVTGERAVLSASALDTARRLKERTDLPVLVGIGVSTPAQAASLVGTADGVIVGSALMRLLLDGSSPAELGVAVGALREAIDAGLAEAS